MNQILRVGRMMEQAGGGDAETPSEGILSGIDDSRETIRLDLVYVLHSSGDVTIAERGQTLPPGSRMLEM